MRNSLWFYVFAFVAIIATVTVIDGAKVSADKNASAGGAVTRAVRDESRELTGNRGRGVRDSFSGWPWSSSVSSSTRQDDYDDYFEVPAEDSDESTPSTPLVVDNFDGGSLEGTTRSQSPANLMLPPADSDTNTAGNNDDMEPAPGQASLVIVLDTLTMSSDLQQLINGFQALVQELNSWDRIPLFNYVLVPGESWTHF